MAERGLLGRLQSVGIRRGVFGASRPWMVVAVVTWALRAARRAAGREEVVVLREELAPGETLVISHTNLTREQVE